MLAGKKSGITSVAWIHVVWNSSTIQKVHSANTFKSLNIHFKRKFEMKIHGYIKYTVH